MADLSPDAEASGPSKTDRRRYPRYRLPAHLSINFASGDVVLAIRDISQGGVSFISPTSIPVDQALPALIDLRPLAQLSTAIEVLDSKMFFADSFVVRGEYAGLSQRDLAILISSLDERYLISDRRYSSRLTVQADATESKSSKKRTGKIPFRNPKKSLLNAVRKFSDTLEHSSASADLLFHTTIALIHNICACIAACEKTGVSRTEILELTKEVRETHARSPFIRRLQSWPRGYPGDFETIGLMLQKRRDPTLTGIPAVLEEYALNTAMAQQHRNKVIFQATEILAAVREANKVGKVPRILVVACGGSPDLLSIETELKDCQFEIVLNDIEKDALALSAQRLPGISNRCEFVCGDVFSTLPRLKGPFDLILAGGLFDYLTDRHIRFFLNRSIRKLSENGRIIFTNVASGNPYRLWLDYIVNWILYERSESDILSISSSLGLTRDAVKMTRDATGLSMLVELWPNKARPLIESSEKLIA